MDDLAQFLKLNHKKVNGCWTTEYRKIPGLTVLSSTTNGTSGIGIYRGKKLYWSHSLVFDRFEVYPA